MIEVVDQGVHRSLYFKDEVVQSRIHRQSPAQLVLRYTQYMMAASLLAIPAPASILLIGVGAGSLLHFFNHYLPSASVDGVEYSPHIIKIARDYFNIPENDHIAVHCEDGLQYLINCTSAKTFDLILLDAFNDHGMAPNIYCNDFLKLARRKMTPNGIICCNLWSGNTKTYNRVVKAIGKNCTSSIYIPVRGRENNIALLFQGQPPWKLLNPPRTTLATLSKSYGIDFKEVSAAARKHNLKLGEQMQLWLN
ncbi:MAG: spermidine synthase [Desulfopila sp.]